MACVAFQSLSTRSMIGSPNAAVLPVPVCASPIKSTSEDSSVGMACCWISVGVSIPNSGRAFSISEESPRSEKLLKVCNLIKPQR